MFKELLTLWSDSAAISVSIWLTLLITILYLGRQQIHQVIGSSFRAIVHTLKLWSYTLRKVEMSLSARNKQILLAIGEAEAQKNIEREFTRINSIVQRDLSHYPALHRQIKEVIDHVESDYQRSADAVPLPPVWGEVISTISALSGNGDPTVSTLLNNIKLSIDEAHQQTMHAYQSNGAKRHKILADMQPDWRDLDNRIDKVKTKIDGLDARTQTIDEQMRQYESIRKEEDKAVSSLMSSSLTQFFISGLVLTIALLGGIVNFQLIAMPMSEMVGGTSYIGGVKTSDIAALVIILIEIAMGLFLLESLRITHLFPIIGSMDDQMRRRMMVITFGILATLATIEASLAYMRDLLALDHEALKQSLAGAMTGAGDAQFRWIPAIGQMVMGFILPFALAFIAIPLESFIHSVRTVIGLFAIGLLRTLRIIVRMAAGVFNQTSKIILGLYDLLIVLPLSVERFITALISKRNTVIAKPLIAQK